MLNFHHVVGFPRLHHMHVIFNSIKKKKKKINAITTEHIKYKQDGGGITEDYKPKVAWLYTSSS